jgi:hypothetical protein
MKQNKLKLTNLHCGIIDRSESGLKVSGLTLIQSNILERMSELRSLGNGELFFGRSLMLGLQILDLLECIGVITVKHESTSG